MTTIITQQHTWRVLDGSRTNLYGQIGFRLIDELTGVGPMGRVQSKLFISDGIGGWRLTKIKAIATASGILAYPKLERHALVAGLPARSYRAQIEAEFYRPYYRATADGIKFDVFPYNDENPPQFLAQQQALDDRWLLADFFQQAIQLRLVVHGQPREALRRAAP